MHWVLQENIFNEDGFRSLEQVLSRLGIPYSTHKVVPFVGDLSPDIDFATGERVVVMGSYSMANYARKKGWIPGSFDNENLDYEIQLPHWGSHMLNSDSTVSRFADVEPQLKPFFIRPTLDSKSFTGFTTDWPSFVEWRDRVVDLGADNGGTLNADTLVQVASKKPIFREYRLWIVDDVVVTSSQYKVAGTPRYSSHVDGRVIDYGTMITSIWSPSRAYVLDIAETAQGFFVLEAGCINAAGFYEADMQKIVMAIEDMKYE